MHDERLAEEILTKLAAAFPNKLRFEALRSSLPGCASADDAVFLTTLGALEADGRIELVGLRDGLSGRLEAAEGIALSREERRKRQPPRPTDPYPDSPEGARAEAAYWASRQGEGQPGSPWEEQVKNRLDHLRFLARAGGGAEAAAGRPETRDSLTGVYDRGQLDRDLPAVSVSQKGSLPLCLAMVDLDHFKAVNDGKGHQEGDRVLCAAAQAMSAACEAKARVYRYGGDEFTILLANFEEAEAAPVAERARRAVERACGGAITASVGVASHRPTEGAESLLRAADDAMYAAKRAGGNRVEFAQRTAGGAEPGPG